MSSVGVKLTYKDSSQTSLNIGFMSVETESSNCFDSGAMARSATRGCLLTDSISPNLKLPVVWTKYATQSFRPAAEQISTERTLILLECMPCNQRWLFLHTSALV